MSNYIPLPNKGIEGSNPLPPSPVTSFPMGCILSYQVLQKSVCLKCHLISNWRSLTELLINSAHILGFLFILVAVLSINFPVLKIFSNVLLDFIAVFIASKISFIWRKYWYKWADTLLASNTSWRNWSFSLLAFFLLLDVLLGVPPVFLVWLQNLYDPYDILPWLSSPEHIEYLLSLHSCMHQHTASE